MAYLIKGIATTPRIDLERTVIALDAFPLTTAVPLLWKHAGQSIGRIVSLTRDGDRALATVICDDDEIAKRAAGFSVNVKMTGAHEMRERGTPNFHAVVTKGVLTELSLVETPANPDCVILSSEPYRDATAGYVKAAGAHTDLIIRKLQTLSKLAGALK